MCPHKSVRGARARGCETRERACALAPLRRPLIFSACTLVSAPVGTKNTAHMSFKEPAPDAFSLGDRRYLKEKIVTSYERLWRGDDVDFNEIFLLKANSHWLQHHIGSTTNDDLFGARKPVVRRIFSECCQRFDDSRPPDVQSHAMETLSGIFLGLGGRTFHNPVAEVLELLCGIEDADGIFARLFAHLKLVLGVDRRGVAAAAVARAAVRLLLSLTAAASDLHRNILVDLIMPHGFEEPSTPRQAAVPPRTRARVGPCILGSRPESRARSHVAH